MLEVARLSLCLVSLAQVVCFARHGPPIVRVRCGLLVSPMGCPSACGVCFITASFVLAISAVHGQGALGFDVTRVLVQRLYINNFVSARSEICNLAAEMRMHGQVMRVTLHSVLVTVVALDGKTMDSYAYELQRKFGEYIGSSPTSFGAATPATWTEDTETISLIRKPFQCVATNTRLRVAATKDRKSISDDGEDDHKSVSMSSSHASPHGSGALTSRSH